MTLNINEYNKLIKKYSEKYGYSISALKEEYMASAHAMTIKEFRILNKKHRNYVKKLIVREKI